MKDTRQVAIYGTEYSTEFSRPNTERAIARYDPDLRLLFNKQLDLFQVMRITPSTTVYHFGSLPFAWLEYRFQWAMDWMDGIERGDNPEPVLSYLQAQDLREHPELDDDDAVLQKIMDERLRREAVIHAAYRHAFLDNRRLLMKAWEPLYNHPALVR